ncbi:Acetyl-coenzyme A synthetase [Zhongshania aliphaticivorans]|uniref:Acetyl-coenzyme A synthetase n=1 Tax=Zhongshania aliphaticivorans TaxID=1470434 RepID=A0A5S9NRP8_9GAMM|nr:AMP-binding protein [Zhongshania aliphaticivorans]CAA0093207.1 Acetyl-coenzyme A synthetase [Zhongshania aliphaticivorans]CAA0110993.1 Acetyl-coenzyme A synthetase [Zhongshania aliphaticivorans]
MNNNNAPSHDATDIDFSWQPPATFNFASDVVDRWAADPSKLALIAENAKGAQQTYSFAEVAKQSCQLANLLKDSGIVQGDRVIVMLPRIPQWQIAMVAVLRMGAIPIPCITMLTTKDLDYRASHAGVKGVITTSAECAKFDDISGIPTRICVGDAPAGWTSLSEAKALPANFPAAVVGINDAAIIYYTSGSTGSPKGVTHASRALWAWENSAEHWLQLNPSDRIWCTADTGWSKAGTSILFGPWSRGSAVLFYDGPFEPAKRFDLLSRHQVTCFCAAATELRQLVLEDASGYDLSHLRQTVSAGESVNPEILTRWKTLTGTDVLDGYGQTETLMTITNRPGRPIKAGSMGRPLPGINIAVRTSDGEAKPISATGELLIGLPNPQVMLSYWQDPERTAGTRIELNGKEWFATGDNVEIDSDGYVFFTGRADDIINSSGYRIGPQEVENALSSHPAVKECAVVGIPDEERGELVKAWVTLKNGTEGDEALIKELQNHVKASTAPYKYPRRIAFTDELPKTVTGKIRRNILREQN